MQVQKKIFYLEDHEFFANTIIEPLEMDYGEIYYAKNYKEAESIIKKHGPFTHSIIDVYLQNGKTGILFVEKNKEFLGKFVFVTGSKDVGTIKTLHSRGYYSISKIYQSAADVCNFIENNTKPMIDISEVC